MMDDPRKELELLEKQLLEDEEWFQRELDSAKRMIGQAPEQPAAPQAPAKPRVAAPAPNPSPVRNHRDSTGQAEPKVRVQKLVQEEPPMPKPKGIKGLLILASLETLGILGLIAYWVLVLLR